MCHFCIAFLYESLAMLVLFHYKNHTHNYQPGFFSFSYTSVFSFPRLITFFPGLSITIFILCCFGLTCYQLQGRKTYEFQRESAHSRCSFYSTFFLKMQKGCRDQNEQGGSNQTKHDVCQPCTPLTVFTPACAHLQTVGCGATPYFSVKNSIKKTTTQSKV